MQTVLWLDKNGIPYWDLCFMRDKDQVGADIYIEDSPQNIQKLRNKDLKVICFQNSTNLDIGGLKAKSWKEVFKIIESELMIKK